LAAAQKRHAKRLGRRRRDASLLIFTAKGAKQAQRTRRMSEEDIGYAFIGAAIKVHSVLGPGLLERAYETCLLHELEKHALRVRR